MRKKIEVGSQVVMYRIPSRKNLFNMGIAYLYYNEFYIGLKGIAIDELDGAGKRPIHTENGWFIKPTYFKLV